MVASAKSGEATTFYIDKDVIRKYRQLVREKLLLSASERLLTKQYGIEGVGIEEFLRKRFH